MTPEASSNAQIEVFSLKNNFEQDLQACVEANPDCYRVPPGKTIKIFSPERMTQCHAVLGPAEPRIFANVTLFIDIEGGDWDELWAEIDGKRLVPWDFERKKRTSLRYKWRSFKARHLTNWAPLKKARKIGCNLMHFLRRRRRHGFLSLLQISTERSLRRPTKSRVAQDEVVWLIVSR